MISFLPPSEMTYSDVSASRNFLGFQLTDTENCYKLHHSTNRLFRLHSHYLLSVLRGVSVTFPSLNEATLDNSLPPPLRSADDAAATRSVGTYHRSYMT